MNFEDVNVAVFFFLHPLWLSDLNTIIVSDLFLSNPVRCMYNCYFSPLIMNSVPYSMWYIYMRITVHKKQYILYSRIYTYLLIMISNHFVG